MQAVLAVSVGAHGKGDLQFGVCLMQGLDGVVEYFCGFGQGERVFLEQAVCLALAVGDGEAAFLEPVAYIGTEGHKQSAGGMQALSQPVECCADLCLTLLALVAAELGVGPPASPFAHVLVIEMTAPFEAE